MVAKENRTMSFVGFYENPKFYRVNVTPTGEMESDGREKFGVTFPILTNKSEKDLELYMRESDYYVDPTAKYAALYEPIKIESYNWKTGMRMPVKRRERVVKKAN